MILESKKFIYIFVTPDAPPVYGGGAKPSLEITPPLGTETLEARGKKRDSGSKGPDSRVGSPNNYLGVGRLKS